MWLIPIVLAGVAGVVWWTRRPGSTTRPRALNVSEPTLTTPTVDVSLVPMPAGVFVSSSGARGIRNHNPGNIRKSSDPWVGLAAVQDDPAFFKFTEAKWGVRALSKILQRYANTYGLKTVSAIINRWAPPSENNTSAYVNAVANDLRVSPAQTIDVYRLLPQLAASIILRENGKQPYSTADLAVWVYLP